MIKNIINKLLGTFLILLLLSVESSLQTSIALDRSLALWTVWLYKLGSLTIADIGIILISLYVLINVFLSLSKNQQIWTSSPYLGLCYLAVVYLFIGFLYNLFVFTNWKTFFYDIKAIIYLTVPYLFLYFCKSQQLRKWFNYKNIFIFLGLSGIIDFVIVSLLNTSEYPSFLGLPSFPSIVPLSVAIPGVIYTKNKLYKRLLLLLILLEIIFSINRLSLGSLYNSAILIISCILIVTSHLNFPQRFLAILGLILFINFTSVFMINNPFEFSMLEAKSDGAITRKIQMENALLNFNENIPGIIGKGLGSTWFEYIPIPSGDIYSVGTSLGETAEDSLSSSVKFIFNWTPPVLIHKWGILGSISIVFLVTKFLHSSISNIERVKSINKYDKYNDLLYPLLIITLIFIIENFTFIGILKSSLITSMLAFELEKNFSFKKLEKPM
jgi:hypothetical protein